MSDLLSGRLVLLAEDETLVSMILEDMLQELGAARIIHAANRAAALKALETATPALALLDVNLGGETSYPIAEALEERKVPFIFVTGYGRDGLKAPWTDRPVLQKPMTLAMLTAAVRGALKGGNI